MDFLKSKFLWLTGSFVFLAAVIKSIVLCKIRLREHHGQGLYEFVQKEARKFVLSQEWYNDEFPKEYTALCWAKGLLFLIDIKERMMHTGQSSTESVVYVTCLRWNIRSVVDLVKDCETNHDNTVKVFLLDVWDADRMGAIEIPKTLSVPYLYLHQYQHIEAEIQRVIDGTLKKTGAILYGAPGNGKTTLVRYFALKYRLPIYLVQPNKDYSNQEVLKMFRHTKSPCIVLFEDFDSFYDNKKCLVEKVNHTFDIFLSVLDGVYATGNGIIYFMTANDISKIDPSLKDRPSRFRFVQEIPNPDHEIRSRVLTDSAFIEETAGMNLDQVLRAAELKTRI